MCSAHALTPCSARNPAGKEVVRRLAGSVKAYVSVTSKLSLLEVRPCPCPPTHFPLPTKNEKLAVPRFPSSTLASRRLRLLLLPSIFYQGCAGDIISKKPLPAPQGTVSSVYSVEFVDLP